MTGAEDMNWPWELREPASHGFMKKLIGEQLATDVLFFYD